MKTTCSKAQEACFLWRRFDTTVLVCQTGQGDEQVAAEPQERSRLCAQIWARIGQPQLTDSTGFAGRF